MIGLLARRTLTDKPRRSLLLLAGYGISVAVMLVLLSIGSAVLEQARDQNLVGGDVVVLPEGVDVEVMKVGGATGMFFSIDNARFIFRQVLSGPRYAALLERVPAPHWSGEAEPPPLAAAAPLLGGKVVYVRRWRDAAGTPRRALAHGVIPGLERAVTGAPVDPRGTPIEWNDSHLDRMWMEPPVDSLYNEIDRFHLPATSQLDRDRWAEWLYFNFTDPATGTYGFLSTIVAGDIAAGRGRALPLLQIVRPGRAPVRYAGDMPLALGDISTAGVDLRFGNATRVRFENGAWRLRLDWQSRAGEVRGDLEVQPGRDLDFPPFLIHSSERFVSGYVVPAIRARMSGWIEAGGQRLELQQAPAYHDHNWGTWRNVHWDWGTAGDFDQALFYGRVVHPDLRPGSSGAGVFCMLSRARRPGERGGFLGLFRPDSIAYEWRVAPSGLPGSPRRIPQYVRFVATHDVAPVSGDRSDRIDVSIDVRDVLSTAPSQGDSLVFLQGRGTAAITARIGGQAVALDAPGFVEVFVPSARRSKHQSTTDDP